MEKELRKLIESEYGNLDDLKPLRRTQVFNEIYMVLVRVMERDFDYALQIVEKKHA